MNSDVYKTNRNKLLEIREELFSTLTDVRFLPKAVEEAYARFGEKVSVGIHLGKLQERMEYGYNKTICKGWHGSIAIKAENRYIEDNLRVIFGNYFRWASEFCDILGLRTGTGGGGAGDCSFGLTILIEDFAMLSSQLKEFKQLEDINSENYTKIKKARELYKNDRIPSLLISDLTNIRLEVEIRELEDSIILADKRLEELRFESLLNKVKIYGRDKKEFIESFDYLELDKERFFDLKSKLNKDDCLPHIKMPEKYEQD